MVWKEITDVLSVLTTKLFDGNHNWNSLTIFVSLCWRVCKFSPDTSILVSFANSTNFDPEMFKGKSFTYKENSMGPKLSPVAPPVQYV